MLQLSLKVNVKVVTGGECRHVRGLWSEVGPCMKAAANVRSERWHARNFARRTCWWAKKVWNIGVTQMWATFWLQLGRGTDPNSSSLIMDPSIDACWEMQRSRGQGRVRRNELVPKKLHWGSNLRESFATFHLWEWKHVKRGIYETFGDDHTQNTHQMLIYTHFKGNTQSGSHTHTQKHTQCCHWHFLQVKAGI